MIKDNKKCLMRFSEDGKFFAYYLEKDEQIIVFEIKNGHIEGLIN